MKEAINIIILIKPPIQILFVRVNVNNGGSSSSGKVSLKS